MRRLATLGDVWSGNLEFDAQTDPNMPRWRYYGQARPYLYPLERVCGTEREVDAMRRNGASPRCVVHGAALLVALACAFAL